MVLAASFEHFELVGEAGASRRRFKCLHCDYTFHTKIDAMLAHRGAHLSDDYIKIYAIRKGKNAGGYRPEQHSLGEKRTNPGGTDAAYDHVVVSESTLFGSGGAHCRWCNDYLRDLNSRVAQALGHRVRAIRKHEARCRARHLGEVPKKDKNKTEREKLPQH